MALIRVTDAYNAPHPAKAGWGGPPSGGPSALDSRTQRGMTDQ